MHQHYQISNLIEILLKFFTAFNFGSNTRKRRKKLIEFWKNLRTFVQFFQTFLLFYVKSRLRGAGIDENLAHHLGHLFCRDPISAFEGDKLNWTGKFAYCSIIIVIVIIFINIIVTIIAIIIMNIIVIINIIVIVIIIIIRIFQTDECVFESLLLLHVSTKIYQTRSVTAGLPDERSRNLTCKDLSYSKLTNKLWKLNNLFTTYNICDSSRYYKL